MEQSLDDFGILRGTDKSSLNHDYLRHYERILGHLRHDPITLLEIGVFWGGSLAMWEDFLPSGRIVGVDINPECAQYAGGRREVEIGSQADPAFLDGIGRRLAPHVIIDDGSHLSDHVILTFRALFRHLRPGGIYIVEDIHFHAGQGAARWRGESDVEPQDVLLRIARLVSCPGTEGDGERDWARQVDTVEFFYGGVAIRKRPAKTRAEVAARRVLVKQANLPRTWAAYALHAYNNTLDLSDAVQAVQRAIEAEPRNPEHHEGLSLILERAGDRAGAANAMRKAVALNPGDRRRQARLVALEAP
jgi:tetratricopeptide (TPR) repeat protein